MTTQLNTTQHVDPLHQNHAYLQLCTRRASTRAELVVKSVHVNLVTGGGTMRVCSGGGGEAQKTLPSFSLPPSIAPELQRLVVQQRCRNRASIFMHLEPSCVRSVRVRARGEGTSARAPQASRKGVNVQMFRSGYMMGPDLRLSAPNLDQCESLRDPALPAPGAKHAG
ncbi:unnamed protein product [Pleuronectes platessa]|uniref:Uncharacterized protein n=1 Tax=Pleuronectes platessa TaxID=8262 RepID=A0A9N7UTR3_PLEPL|nr:unnamed protein product [Pleuronectes platessa]